MKIPVPQILTVATLGLIMNVPVMAEATFDYDHTAPLNVRETSREIRGAALVRDLTFTPASEPVAAYLVTPVESRAPHAAIFYVHWLGEPDTTNRTEFLDEAVALAGRGVVSLLVDCMWSKPKWYNQRIPEEDYAHSVEQVIALCRGLDLLLAQPGIDPQRVALVGHDFGAMYGLIAGAHDSRPKTYVLMAGIPHLIDWMLYSRQPKDMESFRAQLAPLDPVNFVPQLKPASVFYQFAKTDEYVSAAQATELYDATLPRKHMATYEAGHDLHTAEVAADRVAWLERELGLK